MRIIFNIQEPRHPTPSWRLPLLTVTTLRSLLKTQSLLLRNSVARSRSKTRLRFKPNSPIRYRITGTVRRYCQAVLQATRWPCGKDDPDKSISPNPAMSEQNCPAHREAFFDDRSIHLDFSLLNHPALSLAFHAKRRSTANYEPLSFHCSR
jgi:hypothetical protein